LSSIVKFHPNLVKFDTKIFKKQRIHLHAS
jgi:hypothetical protein